MSRIDALKKALEQASERVRAQNQSWRDECVDCPDRPGYFIKNDRVFDSFDAQSAWE